MIGLLLVAGLLNPRADLLLGAVDVPIDPFTVAAAELTEDHALAIVADEGRARYLRVRAVAALGVFASPRARAALERCATADLDVQVRIQATVMIARRFGLDAPAEVVPDLLTWRVDAPPALRRVIDAELARLAP